MRSDYGMAYADPGLKVFGICLHPVLSSIEVSSLMEDGMFFATEHD